MAIVAVCTCAAAIAYLPTLAAGASPPVVATGTATDVANGSVTLNASVNPNGVQTNYALQWGPTSAYGHETELTSAGAGTSSEPVSASVTGLSPGTTYYFRVIAVSSAGTTVGNDASFTTTGTAPAPSPAPTATTGLAGEVGPTAARVNGEVNPHGQATTYYFEYGTNTAYGLETPPYSAGSGTGTVAVHAVLGGLAQGTVYHYRLVATSAGGTATGGDQSVSVGPGQSHVAFMGRMGFVSPGDVIGVEAGCFGGQTACVGHVTMSLRSGTVIGERNFDIAPATGGYQNLKITAVGKQAMGQNSVWHLIQVNVVVTTTTGQHTSQTMSLARWVWH
jgi:hypothetical protein